MRRRELLVAAFAAAQSPLAARSQTSSKRVGLLFPGVLGDQRFRLVRQGIDAAPREGELVVIDARSAHGDVARLRSFAEEFVAAEADVILAIGSASLKAAVRATQKIPIVALDLETDPIATGVAASLFRPGGNVTGIFFDAPEVAGKWLQLLKEVLPTFTTAALLHDAQTDDDQVMAAEGAARMLGVGTRRLPVDDIAQLGAAMQRARDWRVDAVVVHSSPLFVDRAKALADLALELKLPSISLFPVATRFGGLLSYGPDNFVLLPQVGLVVGKVLRGAAPATYPIERPTRFILAVNLKTASRLGLVVPSTLIAVADEVIE